MIVFVLTQCQRKWLIRQQTIHLYGQFSCSSLSSHQNSRCNYFIQLVTGYLFSMTKSAGASVTAKAKELKKAVADNVRL